MGFPQSLTRIELPIAILPHFLLTSGPFFFSRIVFFWKVAWKKAKFDMLTVNKIFGRTRERSDMFTGALGSANRGGVENGCHVSVEIVLGEMVEANFQERGCLWQQVFAPENSLGPVSFAMSGTMAEKGANFLCLEAQW